jgi:hypothetical protein
VFRPLTDFELVALPSLTRGVSFAALCDLAERSGATPAALTRTLLGWLGEELLAAAAIG